MQDDANKKEQKLYSEYDDALFRLAMHKVAEQEGKLISEEMKHSDIDEPEYLPSKESEERLLKLIDRELKKKKNEDKRKRKHLTFKRTLIVIAAVIGLFSISLMTVSAFRIQVFNFVLGINDRYTSFQLQDNGGDQINSQMIVDWKNTYVPTYLPEGYEVSDIYNTDDLKSITFKDKQDNSLDIVYSEFATSSNMELDTENAALVKTITINGNKGTLITKNNITTVAWIMDNKIFSVMGQASSDLLIKISESVKYVK